MFDALKDFSIFRLMGMTTFWSLCPVRMGGTQRSHGPGNTAEADFQYLHFFITTMEVPKFSVEASFEIGSKHHKLAFILASDWSTETLFRFCGSLMNVFSVATGEHSLVTCTTPFHLHFHSQVNTGLLVDNEPQYWPLIGQNWSHDLINH